MTEAEALRFAANLLRTKDAASDVDSGFRVAARWLTALAEEYERGEEP